MPWLGPPEHGRRPPRPPRRCSVLTAQHLSIPSPGDVDRRPAQTGRVADLVPRILPPYNHLGDARVCFPLGFSVCSASLPPWCRWVSCFFYGWSLFPSLPNLLPLVYSFSS